MRGRETNCGPTVCVERRRVIGHVVSRAAVYNDRLLCCGVGDPSVCFVGKGFISVGM